MDRSSCSRGGQSALLEALSERELLDLKLAVVGYAGRHGMPARVGRDLLTLLLGDAARRPRLESAADWEGHIRWINADLNDAAFGKKLRQCIEAGYYSLSD